MHLILALAAALHADTLTKMMIAMNDDVDRMTRLVQNLLALARTEAPLDLCNPVDLNHLVQALLQQFHK